jgi:predicted ATP-grasp superfamily ATP-dependent carboligase
VAERLLICALSGRALAQSAREAGLAPVVLDRFGDLDTREAAETVVVPSGRRQPFARTPLLRAAARLAPAPIPLVWGGGFDGAPSLLAAIARGRELLGNRPELVRRVTDPFALAADCARLGVPVPEIRAELPDDRAGWLVKRRGGSGGGHVRDARRVRALAEDDYVQRRVPGRAVSVLLLGSGRGVSALAVSEQWHEGWPPRFTGVLVPARPTGEQLVRLKAAAVDLAAAYGLVGLASADFLLDGDRGFHLLEINGRPGASLEAAELVLGVPLLGLHVAACRGAASPSPPPPRTGFAATAIVWADRDLVVPDGFAWPGWAGDRTPPGWPVRSGHPLATVRAGGEDPARTLHLLEKRRRWLLAAMAPYRHAPKVTGPREGMHGER